jgi:unsaturated rhamnogalacturonyl hydrolase
MDRARLCQIVDNVIQFTAAQPGERITWEKAPAISGLLAWDNEAGVAKAVSWLERTVALQNHEGNLDYADREEFAHGHIRAMTPTAAVTSCLAYPLLTLYEKTGERRYLDAVEMQLNALMTAPRTRDGGVWTRHESPELFVDIMYFVCLIVARYGILRDRPTYVDESFLQYRVHVDHLRDPRTKLMRHAWCETPDHYPQSMFWGRGNGWFLAAAVDLLAAAPDHPDRAFVESTVLESLSAIGSFQDRSGYLRNIIDDPRSKIEASATLMYAYACARAVSMGLLPDERLGAASLALEAVAGAVTPEGAVMGVVVPPGGPGVPFSWTFFGQGFFLLAAKAIFARS